MRIGRLEKLTQSAFPGKVAAVVFTQGCNFRCGYCHAPELVCPHLFQPTIPEQEVLDYLHDRRGVLNGVVVSGGEPTVQKDLKDFLIRIKRIGLLIKLDTNGSLPEILATLIDLKLIDYIAMDVKTSLEKYKFCEPQNIEKSIEIILKSGLPHQFRTTLVKKVCTVNDLQSIQGSIAGADRYTLQSAILSSRIIDPLLNEHEQYSTQEIEGLKIQFER